MDAKTYTITITESQRDIIVQGLNKTMNSLYRIASELNQTACEIFPDEMSDVCAIWDMLISKD